MASLRDRLGRRARAFADHVLRPAADDAGTTGSSRGLLPVAKFSALKAKALTLSRRRVCVLAVMAILSAATALVLSVASDGLGHPVDFDIYRMGGANVLGLHLYDVRLSRSLMGGSRGMHFTYPPFAALLFLPFSWLSVISAQVTWCILNVLALAVLTAATIRAVRPDVSARWAWTTALIALLPLIRLEPVALNVAYGQINLFMVLLVILDLTSTIRHGRLVLPRGVLIGIAAAVKLTPLIFIPYLFLTRQFKAAATALAAFLVCGLAAFAIAPHSSSLYWTTEIFDTKRSGNLLYVSDQNLHSALQRVLGTVPSSAMWGLLTIACAVGGLAVAAWAGRASSPMLGILACGVTGLIISPVSWAHHYVWLVPALVWLVLAHDHPRGGQWWAIAAASLFWAAPIWWVHDPPSGYGGPLTVLAANSFFLAALGFLVLTSMMLWSRRASRPQQPPRPRYMQDNPAPANRPAEAAKAQHGHDQYRAPA